MPIWNEPTTYLTGLELDNKVELMLKEFTDDIRRVHYFKLYDTPGDYIISYVNGGEINSTDRRTLQIHYNNFKPAAIYCYGSSEDGLAVLTDRYVCKSRFYNK